jgi:hypothetical protein
MQFEQRSGRLIPINRGKPVRRGTGIEHMTLSLAAQQKLDRLVAAAPPLSPATKAKLDFDGALWTRSRWDENGGARVARRRRQALDP